LHWPLPQEDAGTEAGFEGSGLDDDLPPTFELGWEEPAIEVVRIASQSNPTIADTAKDVAAACVFFRQYCFGCALLIWNERMMLQTSRCAVKQHLLSGPDWRSLS
jgi:hypothetical protein